jgi:hypothetical protein
VAERFLDKGYGQALVLDSTTGEFTGLLTAFDILKSKNWELAQEMPEPSRLSGMSLLRFAEPPRVGEPDAQESGK